MGESAFSKILVPLDGSETTETILPYVSQLAKGLGAAVVVLAVLEESAYGWTASLRQGIDLEVEKAASKRLRNIVNQLHKGGVEAEGVTMKGRASEEIVRAADRYGCDLIAMTTHGRNRILRGILGSVSDEVVHASVSPVLLITPERAATYGGGWFRVFAKATEGVMAKIMVPLDGSPEAEAVLPYVRVLAEKLSLSVLLVNVIPGANVEWLDWEKSGPEDVDLHQRAEAEADAYLEGISQKLSDAGIDNRWQVHVGHPARVLAQIAQLEPHDIIALSSRRGSRWTLGSVAEALVRATGDPVLVITDNTSR
jgi:nucleotide-binding universal stress UspA family protein